jgi:hypothetical protein
MRAESHKNNTALFITDQKFKKSLSSPFSLPRRFIGIVVECQRATVGFKITAATRICFVSRIYRFRELSFQKKVI